MNEHSELLPNLLHEEFEMQMRGYSRRQVDDFVARRNSEIRELEQRLGRSLDETEHMRRELSSVRQQALAGRPAHEEVSERISQILKLADDEAHAQKNKAEDEIAAQRAEAKQESDRVRADAREQAERMLTAAQEQAERTISAARSEAEKTRNTARADAEQLTTETRNKADQLTTETRRKADQALSQAKAQAKRVLDEATARATAIHDGAERRLNLLSTRHGETVRRLTDILDGVQGLVAAEAARMSLEEEVNQTASRTMSLTEAADAASAVEASPAELLEEPFGGRSDQEQDLATLAPPAPETVANGSFGPPAGDEQHSMMPGLQGMTGRFNPPPAEEDFPQRGGSAPFGGSLPPHEVVPRGPFGLPLPAPTAPQTALPEPGPIGGPDNDPYRQPAAMQGGAPFIPGFGGDSLSDLEQRRNGSYADPENPAEGVRLL